MSKIKTIQIEDPSIFRVSDVLKHYTNQQELPKNCVFNKGITGNGATTAAINSNDRYVIVVPFKSIVKDKFEQHSDKLYPISSDYIYTISSIIDAYKSKKQIICTYNSLNIVLDALSNYLSDINLFVDEYHELVISSEYRFTACKLVKDNYKKFKSFIFVSATIIDTEKDFCPNWLKDINILNLEYKMLNKIKVEVEVDTNSLLNIRQKCINLLNNKNDNRNFYIAVPNVEIIRKIISCTDIFSEENTTIHCSEKNKTISKCKIGRTEDLTFKRINFFTRVGFEGIDIYDENGYLIMYSNPNVKDGSLTSIDIQQISGRIRNYSFDKMTFITSPCVKKAYEKEITAIDIDDKNNYQLIELAKESYSNITDQLVYLNRKSKNTFQIIDNDIIYDNTLLMFKKYILENDLKHFNEEYGTALINNQQIEIQYPILVKKTNSNINPKKYYSNLNSKRKEDRQRIKEENKNIEGFIDAIKDSPHCLPGWKFTELSKQFGLKQNEAMKLINGKKTQKSGINIITFKLN